MTHLARAFSGSIINRFTGSKILARVGQISVAFPAERLSWLLTLQKLPMGLHQVMFSLLTVGRLLTSMIRTIVPVSSV